MESHCQVPFPSQEPKNMSPSEHEEFRVLLEKHKAPDQPKTFEFKGMYYRLHRDEYNVMNWAYREISVEKYNSEITGVPLNMVWVKPTAEQI